MADAPPAIRKHHWLTELKGHIFGRGVPTWDAVMVIVAFVDVVALLLRRELLLPDEWATRVLWLDWGVLGLFAAEYAVSFARAEEKGRFVRGTWYDLVGLAPIPVAFLRAFRLLRLPHVVFWGTRFPAEADRRYGGAYALTLFRRYEPIILEDLTDPLLVRLLHILRDAIGRGRYAEAVGEGLEARRDRIREVVMRAMTGKPSLRFALATPGMGSAIKSVPDQLVDVVVTALTDPDLDLVLKESMDEALAELQRKIEARHAALAGG